MQKDSSIVILDVREVSEYKGETGHLANAILIPNQKLEERLGELEQYRSRTIVAYCQRGGRSARAGSMLKEKGFRVLNMDGGILRWNAENRPVIREFLRESEIEHDARMAWWRDARFGLFIHWGLYAIPAGEWKGKTQYGEWIRHNAQIPLEEYDKFVGQFNPVKFDPRAWVRMAKDAGMKYIVITSKHHDGFCLFDSKETDFDVMATPFKRDILKELSEACGDAGIKLCFYHSIMDWHHPDYLPQRDWEKETRSTEGADFDRYVAHMKRQLKELVANYGPLGVLWFDGEWESTWNEKYGKDLYEYVRGLQPSIIINNRVGAGREGMAGITKEGQFGGDFGTPEQEVPATGLPGIDWETCMTMNNNWGYNKNDQHWKSAKELICTLADVASKGGNFLLNVGPTAKGIFPDTSIERLKRIGEWMKENSESIYGTTASPFRSLPWGRCTQRKIAGGSMLYLHVFDWPADGKLVVPGLRSEPKRVYFLADKEIGSLLWSRNENAVIVTLEKQFRNPINTVVAMEISGNPEVADPPMNQMERKTTH
jgi:alpha-L-fucosidase